MPLMLYIERDKRGRFFFPLFTNDANMILMNISIARARSRSIWWLIYLTNFVDTVNFFSGYSPKCAAAVIIGDSDLRVYRLLLKITRIGSFVYIIACRSLINYFDLLHYILYDFHFERFVIFVSDRDIMHRWSIRRAKGNIYTFISMYI